MLLGRDLVALGLVISFASFVLAVLFFSSARDVIAVVAPITTLIGTLIGTIFGVQSTTIASVEQQQASAVANERTLAATERVAVAAALVAPKHADTLLERWSMPPAGGRDGGGGLS